MNYEFHPIADKMPLMSKQEFTDLVHSIKERGLRNEILLLDGRIIDGRNRYRACIEAGVEPRFSEWKPDASSPAMFVWDENAERRHLADGTKASLWLEFEKADIDWALASAAREAMASDNRSESQRGGKNCRDKSSQGTSKRVKKAQNPTRGARAKRSKVSPATMAKAETVQRNAPDLHAKICAGKITLTQAYRILRERKREARREENRDKIKAAPATPTDAKFATIVIDPPWDWGDEGDCDQLGRARPDYGTMSIEQIAALPVADLADTDCHLYLWITNRSLPKGFRLLDAWGFRYVTCLTWCKPSIGMGNYFRGSTEQILFAVRGSQMLKRKDVGTWFESPRGKGHSSKPEFFFELVESCSPGPFLEMFSRRERPDWVAWGADAK